MLILGKIVLGAAGTIAVAAGVLCSEGFVHVDVRESDPEAHHIVVVAPAILAPLCLHFVPADNLQKAAERVRPWMPAIRAATASLREESDMTLVDISEPDEHVAVKKEDGSVVVDIKDGGAIVRVSVPIRAISSALKEIASAGPGGKS